MNNKRKDVHLKKVQATVSDGLKISIVSGTQVEMEGSHDKNILPFTEFL